MRVLVASTAIADLDSHEAGSAIARAWAQLGAQVAVVAMADACSDFAAAAAGPDSLTELIEVDAQPCTLTLVGESAAVLGVPVAPTQITGPIDLEASSAMVGRAVLAALAVRREQRQGWDELVVQCVAPWLHDGGAGLLGVLGARADAALDHGVAGLAGLASVDLTGVRDGLTGVRLTLVTSAEESTKHLTGLRGITAVKGHAVPGAVDPGDLLAIDQHLVDLTAACGAPQLALSAGAGACGGLGFAVLALGGRVVTGPAWLAEHHDLARTCAQADLVVAGCGPLDFGTMGGETLAAVVAHGTAALTPVVVVAETNRVSARELRTIGVESAHALRADTEQVVLDAAEVTRRSTGVARTWTW